MAPIKIGAVVMGTKAGESQQSQQSQKSGSLNYPYPEEHRKFLEKMDKIKKS